MSAGRCLALAAVGSASAGWLIFRLWAWLGMPALGGPLDAPVPGLWQWFFAVWVPLLFLAFSGAHGLLLRAARRREVAVRPIRYAVAWDRWSYVGVLLVPLAMLAWRRLGDWRLVLGALYLGLLFAKTGALAIALYRAHVVRPGRGGVGADPPGVRQLLFVLPLLLYVFLAPYVVTAVSTAGDEHVYLLSVVSLLRDGDTDIANNVARREYEAFYWGRPAPAEWRGGALVFPTLLLPGYAIGSTLLPGYPLAGRLGATLTIALFAALLSAGTYRLCRELGASRGGAFWAWLVMALTPPLVVGAGHLYPEVPAAWAVIVGLRALERLPVARGRGLGGVAAAAAGLVLLKQRYASLAAGLLAWAVVRDRILRDLAIAGLVVGAVLVWQYGDPLPWVFERLGLERLPPLEGRLRWERRMTVALLGLFADQEFGLFYYGPHWLLVVPGAVLLRRRAQGTTFGLLGLATLYIVVVVKYRWLQWDAGWTPPPRFVLVVAPVLAPFLAEAFDRCRGRAFAALNTLWSVWACTVAVALCLVPFWRYSGLTGRSTLLRVAGAWLGLDLARFLPSLRWPFDWTWPGLVVGALLLLVAWRVCLGRRGSAGEGWGAGAVVLPWLQGVGVVVLVFGAWLGLAAVVPTWVVEAEAMRHDRGLQHGPNAFQPVRWVMRQDGELSERIVTWRGTTTIAVVAGGYTTTGTAPRLTLMLDGRPLATWPLEAGLGDWHERTYRVTVPTRFRRPRLTLRLSDLGDKVVNGVARRQHAYVDRIEVRWTAGGPGTSPSQRGLMAAPRCL